MRDGINLVGDVWLPDSGARFPTILIRTPYVRTAQFRRYRLVEYLKHGYAVVLQDTRGRGDSDGTFDFYFPEARDGYDTIEWIARQPWSNGKVGTDGGSYLGTVQWLAARERPSHLACMIPTAPSGRLFDEIPYQGGAFSMGWALEWMNGVSDRGSQNETWDLVKPERFVNHRPLLTMDEAFGRRIPFYRDALTHSTLDSYWKRIQFTAADFAKISIPVLHVTGWYDGDQPGALFYWDGMEEHGPVKENRFLIVGPWVHAQTYLGGADHVGAFTFTPESILDIQGERIKFFDSCLKGSASAYEAPRVRLFVTGSNRWIEANRYPLPQARLTPLYLRSGGKANSLSGDGTLSWETPRAEEADRYTYDPKEPVPVKGVAADHTSIEQRPDVLVYTTPALTDPVEVVGRVMVTIYAATDARDTDFIAKLLDVFPDGRAVKLGPTEAGVRRARYRNGYEREQLLTSTGPEKYLIELYDVGHAFLPGHRIRLEISSSAFPYVNPNQNTGNPVATDTLWKTAHQTIYHDAEHPSRVMLPILPAGR
jgi:putative CocE/NonD family hydrolase